MINEKTTAAARKLIGKLLKQQREELGLSRTVLGSQCGLNFSQVNNAEEGTKSYTIDTLLRLAYGMNCQLFITLEPKITDPDKHDMAGLESPPDSGKPVI